MRRAQWVSSEGWWRKLCDHRFVRTSLHTGVIGDVMYWCTRRTD